MAEVKFKRKTAEELKNLPVDDGSIIFDTTNKKILMDNGIKRDSYGGGDGTGGGSLTVPIANSSTVGGIKADPKTKDDTVLVKIGNDNKLYVPKYSSGGGTQAPTLSDWRDIYDGEFDFRRGNSLDISNLYLKENVVELLFEGWLYPTDKDQKIKLTLYDYLQKNALGDPTHFAIDLYADDNYITTGHNAQFFSFTVKKIGYKMKVTSFFTGDGRNIGIGQWSSDGTERTPFRYVDKIVINNISVERGSVNIHVRSKI